MHSPLMGGPSGESGPWAHEEGRGGDCWGGDGRVGRLQLQEVAVERSLGCRGKLCESPSEPGDRHTVPPKLARFTECKLRGR